MTCLLCWCSQIFGNTEALEHWSMWVKELVVSPLMSERILCVVWSHMQPWGCGQRGRSGISKSMNAHHQQWRELPTYLEGWAKNQPENVGSNEILASCSRWYRPRPAQSELVDQTPSQAQSFVPQMAPEAPCAVQCCAARKVWAGTAALGRGSHHRQAEHSVSTVVNYMLYKWINCLE